MSRHSFIFTVIFYLLATLILAQNKTDKTKADTLNTKINSTKSIDGVTTAGDLINFKNSTGNSIITITDEGSNIGSITLPSGSAPTTTANKLYNEGGTLKFNGSDIGAGSGSSGGWTDSGTKIHNTTLTDKVGIGTNNPLSTLSVGGDGIATANIYGETAVAEGHALHGIASDIKGIGVYGHATNSEQHNDWTTKNYGGYFQADGPWGIGVYGYGTGGNAKGVVGYSLTDIGIRGITESGTASGIRGEATATGTGVNASGGYFEASGDLGYGVYGYATSTNSSAVNYGGYFKSDGGQGFGVYGDVSSGTGVHGEAISGTGVHGYTWASDGIGVHGEAPASGTSATNYGGKFRSGGQTGIGVFGEATYSAGTTTNYGGKFIASGYNGGGIFGEATGYSGRGVFGLASNTGSGQNYGGYFKAKGNAGEGVYGEATGSSGKGVTGSGTAYDFDAVGPGINYGSTSSIRWKKNVVEIDNPLEKLSKLRGVYFDWDEKHGGSHDIGCIAEEVGQVLPEIVAYEKNGIDADGMDYSKLTPLLLEVAKAQQKLIEELTNRIKILENNQNKK